LPTPQAGPKYDGSLSVGAKAQVTPGACLNARSSAGGDIASCVAGGAVVTIVDGPVYANGHWWWQLQGYGWSVDSFLVSFSGSAQASGSTRPATSYGFIWPTSGSISDGFGVPRGGGSYHNGIDIANPGVHGRPVAASASGRVVLAQIGYGGGLGNHVIISHDNGLESVYAHLSALTVSLGQYVSQGDLVGYTGCTGYCLGEHLHFEIRRGGVPTNPLNYLP
jgi:murein DD-endopeptidase MepM/ murein hydrolase activator NlpD